MTVILSWRGQIFVVIGGTCFKQKHCKFWSNVEFGRNTVISGTGSRSKRCRYTARKGVRYPLKIEEIMHSVTTYIKLKWPCLANFCGHGCGRSEALSSFWYLIKNLAEQWSCSPHSNTKKVHPVAHPRGRTMRCLLSVQRLTHVFAELFPISRDIYTAI